MATLTAGSNATTTLTALQFTKDAADADIRAMQQAILDSAPLMNSGVRVTYPGAWSKVGQLFIPNRGTLYMKDGDWLLLDPTTGWPMLLSRGSMAKTAVISATTHNASAVLDTFASSPIAAGWQRGMPIVDADGDIPAAAYILDLTATSVTISIACTNGHAGQNITVGNFTHS